MTGAISFLQHVLQLCDSREDCAGCPCEVICRRRQGFSRITADSLAGIVRNVEVSVRTIEPKVQGKKLYVSRYNTYNGGASEESWTVVPREVDAFLSERCQFELQRLSLTDKDIVRKEQYVTEWDDGRYSVFLQLTHGEVDPVRLSGFETNGEEKQEKYNAFLSVALRIPEDGFLHELYRFVPETEEGVHSGKSA